MECKFFYESVINFSATKGIVENHHRAPSEVFKLSMVDVGEKVEN